MFKMFAVSMLLCVSTAASAQTVTPDFSALRQQYLKPPAQWPKATLDHDVTLQELGLLPLPSFPPDNPLTHNKVALGKKLFFDPKLSRSKQIACASCHDSDLGWGDGRQFSFGHDRQTGNRNAPSIENSGYYHQLFWDGRASSLEQQALMPITNPIEMNFTLNELVIRLNKDPDYPRLFSQVFGSTKQQAVNADNIAKAIATYERTIISRLSSFDRFLLAPSQTQSRRKLIFNRQFSDQALWGLHLYRTKARCLNCHNGALMSDNEFHNIGLTYYQRSYQDLGRYLATNNNDDVGKFKTPSLRGVMNNKPWMHNGLFSNMRGIISLYNMGGPRNTYDASDLMAPKQSTLLKPLNLTAAETDALVEFLTAITAPPAQDSSSRIMATLVHD
ncbi:MAG: cytochrome-c peroxidase [Gammaproteobacteria bacterium]|nr:cytochrome-c peroxidase [Gammaproteobacteria bacterium]